MSEQQPYFDDTRRALTFALNYEGEVKAPTMSRILAQAQNAPKRVSKAARKRYLKQVDPVLQPELYAYMEALLDGKIKASRKTPWHPPSPKGLDGAHLAGLILAQFSRLEEHRRGLLEARVIQAYSRCACGSPCCSGWRKHPRWAAAIVGTCKHLQHVGDILREPGKRGLSSQPELRLAVVEQYFTHNDLTLTDLARIAGGLRLETVAKHKEWITSYLKQEEDSSWRELDAIFDVAGITGAFS